MAEVKEARVCCVRLVVSIHTSVHIPKHIKLSPFGEGVEWWFRYNRLYYNEGGKIKVHTFPEIEDGHTKWDGDFKNPEVEEIGEEEEEDEGIEEEVEEEEEK